MDKSLRVKGWESVVRGGLYGCGSIPNWAYWRDRAEGYSYKGNTDCFDSLARIIAIRASKREWQTSDVDGLPITIFDDSLPNYDNPKFHDEFCEWSVRLEIEDFLKQCPDLQPTESMYRALTDEIHEQYVNYEAWLGTQKPEIRALAACHGVDPDDIPISDEIDPAVIAESVAAARQEIKDHGTIKPMTIKEIMDTVDPDNGDTIAEIKVKIKKELGIIYGGEHVLSNKEVDRLVDAVNGNSEAMESMAITAKKHSELYNLKFTEGARVIVGSFMETMADMFPDDEPKEGSKGIYSDGEWHDKGLHEPYKHVSGVIGGFKNGKS